MADMTAALLFDDLTPAEVARAERVESVLPALAAAAVEADRTATFPVSHVATLGDAGLLGLVVPERFGGLGGGLRDLTAAGIVGTDDAGRYELTRHGRELIELLAPLNAFARRWAS